MYKYEGMNKISKMEALSRFNLTKSVYLLYSDNTESLVKKLSDIENHEELFGYEEKVGLLQVGNEDRKCLVCGMIGYFDETKDKTGHYITCKCGDSVEMEDE